MNGDQNPPIGRTRVSPADSRPSALFEEGRQYPQASRSLCEL